MYGKSYSFGNKINCIGKGWNPLAHAPDTQAATGRCLVSGERVDGTG
jgi:hypothetical protein